MGRKRKLGVDQESPSLRRSARLAGLPPSSEPSQQLAKGLDRPSSSSHTRGKVRDQISTMKLAISPPDTMTAGVALKSSLVVTFEASDSVKQRRHDESSIRDISGIWAYLSLMTEDGSRSLAPPRTDLLRGRTADSIHPILRAQEGDIQTIGYVTFSDLAVTEPGRYCFKIDVIDMNSVVFDESNNGGKVLEPLQSKVFEVMDNAEEHDFPDVQTVTKLQEIGVSL